MKIIGILVCQPMDVLNHKKEDGKQANGKYCFWQLTRFPKKIKEALFPESTGIYSRPAKIIIPIYDEDDLVFEDFEVRLFFAVKGVVQGYFTCKACDKDLTQLRFFSESWQHSINVKSYKRKKKGGKRKVVKVKTHKRKSVPREIKPSQGWRYYELS